MFLPSTLKEMALMATLRMLVAVLRLLGREMELGQVERQAIVHRVETALLEP
jgi:hypothetical protein